MEVATVQRFEAKIDKMTDWLQRIDVILAKQEENLKEHMRRTTQSEKDISDIEEELISVNQDINFVWRLIAFICGFTTLVSVGIIIYKNILG